MKSGHRLRRRRQRYPPTAMPKGTMTKDDPSQVTASITGVSQAGRWPATKVATAGSANVSPLCASTPHNKKPKAAALRSAAIDQVIRLLTTSMAIRRNAAAFLAGEHAASASAVRLVAP